MPASISRSPSESRASPEHRRRRPAQHGADARGELARRERLRHVVVGAELEADDPVGLLAARGQQDHGQVRARPDPAAEREPVGAGQHHVEHDEVRRIALEQLARAVAVRRLERPVALALEVADDDLAHDRLVVDDEDGRHVRIVTAAIVAAALKSLPDKGPVGPHDEPGAAVSVDVLALDLARPSWA